MGLKASRLVAFGALLALGLAFPFGTSAGARAGPAGLYRIDEGPDVAGALEVAGDGRFRYVLAAGALDERAEGRWEADGPDARLYTEPRPVPPEFSLAPPPEGDGPSPDLLVTWPGGRGIAGVDFRIGFTNGEAVAGYTQYDGWSLPPDDPRIPAWIELAVPMHGLASPRFDLDEAVPGPLRFILTPNDLGIVDFQGARLEVTTYGAVLHRAEGDLRFRRSDD